jgi:hypothetical protein
VASSPTRRRATARSGDTLTGLVGWVFADTLLALSVVFLATQDGTLPLTTTTDPVVEEEPVEPVLPPGVDSRYICFRVSTDAAALGAGPSTRRDAALADIRRQVSDRLSRPDLAGRRAGIVLTFGVSEEPGPGRDRAETFNREVLPRFPEAFSRPDGGPVASRSFWDGRPAADQPADSIAVNIYPIVDDLHPPLGPDAVPAC